MDRPRSHEELAAFYKEKFKKEQAAAFEILQLGGVHPDHQEPMSNPYMEGGMDNENFGNIGEHCIDVGICADKITTALESTKQIPPDEKHTIVHQAIVHDSNKRFEVMRRKAQKAGRPLEVYSRSAYETMFSVLQAKGHNEADLEYLKTAGRETGHSSLVNFIKMNPDGTVDIRTDRTLAELIVHAADDMVASPLKDAKTGDFITKNTTTKFVTVSERMDLGNFENRYPFLYEEGIAFDEAGNAVEVKSEQSAKDKNLRGFKNYAYWQAEATKLICAKLKDLIARDNPKDPEIFIKELLNS
jgi:hypothetical protein